MVQFVGDTLRVFAYILDTITSRLIISLVLPKLSAGT